MNKILLKQTLTLAMIFLMGEKAFSQKIVTVTDCNLQGWVKQPIGNSFLGFVNGPEAAPLGKGSLKFSVPAGGIFWPGDFVRLRNGDYTGTSLSEITELAYSTYVEARDTMVDIPFLVVLVDINGNGSAEHNLVFDPRYQRPPFIHGSMPDQGITKEKVWQSWDLLHAGWFYGGTTDTDPDHNGPFFTLAEYLALYPDAKIRNDPAKGGPAIRLTAGGVVFKPNFYGEVDAFKIGINGQSTTYDFELNMADAGVDRQLDYGYGGNCVTLTGTARGGVEPYLYEWSPGGASTNNSEVCPITTTTYTLTVTDARGCKSADDVTVSVNDVRCGSKSDKVLICHNGNELCVDGAAAAAHLKHGDALGHCNLPEQFILKNGYDERGNKELLMTLQMQNFPNPAGKSALIEYYLPHDGSVSLKLFDPLGKEVSTFVNKQEKQGKYIYSLNTYSLNRGLYYIQLVLKSGDNTYVKTNKMVVTK